MIVTCSKLNSQKCCSNRISLYGAVMRYVLHEIKVYKSNPNTDAITNSNLKEHVHMFNEECDQILFILCAQELISDATRRENQYMVVLQPFIHDSNRTHLGRIRTCSIQMKDRPSLCWTSIETVLAVICCSSD